MHKANGGCHCGNIAIGMEITAAPATYRPRACDCNFCRKHGAAWLSDAKGSLLVQIRDLQERGVYRQGSGQAEFIVCTRCGVLMCVLYRIEQRLYAAVNVRAMDDALYFDAEQTVSPQKLSADEKTTRWENVWFSDVRIREGV